MPTFFIPHGGGPCFFMGEDGGVPPMWRSMADFLGDFIKSLPERPVALLVVSGHWEEAQFTVHSGKQPSLLFDYYGFPENTYHLRWDAPGAPWLAERVQELLTRAGFATGEEKERGWDHGVFIPLKVALPEADIPVLQLSLRADLDAAAHLAAGKALAPLRDEGVLIIGSGMSFHNLRALGPSGTEPSKAFDAWLGNAVIDSNAERREALLSHWEDGDAAKFAHPREEHLIPLMVAAGAAGDDPGTLAYQGDVLGWTVSGYRFG